ncbi:hypothetical protein GCM10017783_12430 [Deinococcus piscis]|uniref:Uncharacterized protein n=1 Tax=Deinococcus piscis TaxID=394230 RepID=A0ABQ3K617_9DEIO|nr:hypothetical protein [Deinococcus piscis]GHG01695.1 hypothetical protein GCM10017783_12430 [Deinococcus piscis]
MKKHWYAIYGSGEPRILSIGEKLHKALDCEFQERDSSYIGVYLKANVDLSGKSVAYEIKIRSNSDPQFGGLEEPEYPQFQTLVYVNRITDIAYFELKVKAVGLERISLREI